VSQQTNNYKENINCYWFNARCCLSFFFSI